MAEVNNFYDEVTTGETDTTDAWSDTSCTVSGLAATTLYLIVAKALFGGGDAADNYGVRVETADDTGVESKSEARMEPTFTASDELEPYLFVHSFTTDSSPDNVTIQTRSWDATTLNIDQMSLLLIDLGDLGSSNYFENIDSDDSVELDVSSTFTTLANLTDSDLGTTEEWMLLGYARIGIGSGGVSFDVRLRAANDASSQSTISFHRAEGEDTNELRVIGVAGRHKAVTSDVAAAIEATEESGNGNMLNRGGYLIALKASAFADFKFDFESGTATVTSSETTIATVTDYTPSTATNHLIVGVARLVDATGNSRTVAYVENGAGTKLMAGDDVAFQTQNWDNTDLEMILTLMRESLPASQDTFDVQAIRHSSDSDRLFGTRWLLMLNLELANGAPAVGQPTMKRMQGIPTQPGSRDRIGRWN